MAKKNKTIIQSAKFKRDYVTMLALLFFGFMVLCEIVVAVSIPLITKYTNFYALEELKHSVIFSFDYTRKHAKPSKSPNDDNVSEVALVRWDLDQMAPELRKNQYDMEFENLCNLLDILKGYDKILENLNENQDYSYFKKANLNLDNSINNILEQVRKRK